jgi:hypothetical protein
MLRAIEVFGATRSGVYNQGDFIIGGKFTDGYLLGTNSALSETPFFAYVGVGNEVKYAFKIAASGYGAT